MESFESTWGLVWDNLFAFYPKSHFVGWRKAYWCVSGVQTVTEGSLFKNLLLQVSHANLVLYLQSSPFHHLHNFACFCGYNCTRGSVNWKAAQTLMTLALCQEPALIMWYCYTSPTHSGFKSQAAKLVPTTLFVLTLCMLVFVCVCGLSARGNAKFPLNLCGMWHSRPLCEQGITVAGKRLVKPTQLKERIKIAIVSPYMQF